MTTEIDKMDRPELVEWVERNLRRERELRDELTQVRDGLIAAGKALGLI